MSVGLNDTLRSFQLGVAAKDDNYRVTCRDGVVGIDTNDVGKLKRLFRPSASADQIQQNNDVRTMLLDALSSQFNGRQNIPASVLKALNGSNLFGKSDMKCGYNGEVDSGRPLTVRRVRQVLDAVVRELSHPTVGQETESKPVAEPSLIIKEDELDLSPPEDNSSLMIKPGELELETLDNSQIPIKPEKLKPEPHDYSHLLIKPEELEPEPHDYSHLLIKPEDLEPDPSQVQNVNGNKKNGGSVRLNMPWPVVDENRLKQLEEQNVQMQSKIGQLWTLAKDKPFGDPLRVQHAQLERDARIVRRDCDELKAQRQIGQWAKDIDSGLLASVANEVLIRSSPEGKPPSELWKDAFTRQMLNKEMQMLASNGNGDCERYLQNAGAAENEIPALKGALTLLKTGFGNNKYLVDRVRAELDNIFSGRADGDVSLVNFAQRQLLKELRDIAEARKYAGKGVELQKPRQLNEKLECRPMGLKNPGDLAEGRVFKQTFFGNLCPILSTMNAMMLTNKGMADRLRAAMLLRNANDGKGQYFEFPYKLEQSKGNLRIYLNDLGKKDMQGENARVFNSLSQFEKAAYMAMKKAALLGQNELGGAVRLGDFFEVGGAFRLFGLDEPKQIDIPNSKSGQLSGELCRVGKQVADELSNGKVCVFRKPGHFMALRSVTFDKDGVPSFKVFDSSSGSEIVYSPNDLTEDRYEIYCAGPEK